MYLDKTITADEITDYLIDKHAKDLWFEELRLSSGFAWQGRIDFLSLSVSPSNGNLATAYEVKISKADFKRDTHKKQRGARLFSDRFYYIAPTGIIDPDAVPDWAGLIEVSWKSVRYRGGTTVRLIGKEIIPAPKRDKDQPSWGLVCSLIRNSTRKGGSI